MKFQSPADSNIYTVDWSADLGVNTIASSVWSADTGITLSAPTSDSTTASVTATDGTAGMSYRVTNTVTSSIGEVFSDSFYLRIQNNHN